MWRGAAGNGGGSDGRVSQVMGRKEDGTTLVSGVAPPCFCSQVREMWRRVGQMDKEGGYER